MQTKLIVNVAEMMSPRLTKNWQRLTIDASPHQVVNVTNGIRNAQYSTSPGAFSRVATNVATQRSRKSKVTTRLLHPIRRKGVEAFVNKAQQYGNANESRRGFAIWDGNAWYMANVQHPTKIGNQTAKVKGAGENGVGYA